MARIIATGTRAERQRRWRQSLAVGFAEICAKREEVSRRLANKTVRIYPTGCAIWTGDIGRNGYGALSVCGKRFATHRLAYMLAYGSIPDGAQILHSCDVPACVNPKHLRAGTSTDNNRDTIARGRNFMANKTHCKNGHAFDDVNTYRRGTKRGCRTCNRMAARAYRERNRDRVKK